MAPTDKESDELDEALEIAMRWKDTPQIAFEPNRVLGILARALLASRVELINETVANRTRAAGGEECSGCRRLTHRLEKIDKALDEAGAPVNGDWDGLTAALSQVGRIKRLTDTRSAGEGRYDEEIIEPTLRLLQQWKGMTIGNCYASLAAELRSIVRIARATRSATTYPIPKGEVMHDVERIARIAHEVNRAYCLALGDDSQPAWEAAPEWQRTSAINGVSFHIANPDAGPDHSHIEWLKEKQASGWKYGPVKDADKKEHPCFVPYAELPVEQKAKDYLFRGVVHALTR